MASRQQDSLALESRRNGHSGPPLPLREIPLSENARTVLTKRYLRRGADGAPAENIHEMFWRVASHVAAVEPELKGDQEHWSLKFYDLLTEIRFFPNSPTFTGAGTPLGQLAACFVLPISDDMGRDPSGIFQTLRDAALIQQTGGGNGFSFSRLRPKGALVRSSMGKATGPVGFLRVYDQAFGEIAQGGCLVPETLVFTEEGLLRLDEIVRHGESGWRDHELSVATDEGMRFSSQGYNHGVSPVLQVRTAEGLELTGTPNHKVKVMTSEGPIWRRLDELQSGDAVLVKLGQHRGRYRALRQPMQQHGNQTMPCFPPILDETLAFLIGYMVGDGFVAQGEHDHRLGVTVAHGSYLIDAMPQLFKQAFGSEINVHCQQKANDASCTFVVDNRAVKDFLHMNGLAKTVSTRVNVPRLIRQSPPEVVGAFLRGLFEADGSVLHGYPQLLSSSKTLIRDVATLLIGLGCPARIVEQATDESHFGTNPMWSLRVVSFVGLARWKSAVGCDPRSRFSACMAHRPDLARESSYILPEPGYWLEPVLEATVMPQIDSRGRGMGKNFRSTSPNLRRQLLRYTRGERQLTLSAYANLQAAYGEFAEHARSIGDLWFVTVSDVVDAGDALTLDLEVEGNHTYLAGGWVTHNSRRGANMAVLRVDHPDIREFITCKTNESQITNFNISVGVTDAFMRAVEEDGPFDLVNPVDGTVVETVRARDLFDLIATQAHHNGEPGMLFLDTANRSNPVLHLYDLEATNPCGEQWLGPYENCCLGSINLAQHLTDDRQLDWERLQRTVEEATRFLDDVVTANAYVPAVPQLKESADRVRRIGLGIMGVADVMYDLGVRYGSTDGQEFAAQVMEFVRYHTMKTSIKLAKERGPFPAIKGSLYDPDDLKWEPPQPVTPYERDWGRPRLDWASVVKGLKKHGIRNGAQNTIAPTGTISTVAGCEGYGCEPVFALAYIRHVNDNGQDLELQYTSPAFDRAMRQVGLDDDAIEQVVRQVSAEGSCQNVDALPEDIRRVFVVSSDVTAEEHVRMQAAFQAFVDNSISKTINMPETATPEDVKAAYRLAWELGCKGLTVYVTGSRQKVVLETRATKSTKAEDGAEAEAPVLDLSTPPTLFNEEKKPRPRRLNGRTYRSVTPLGTTYLTINENGHGEGQPFEVFLHTSKAGSDTAAVSEALGRLVSYILRLASPVSPRKRLQEIIRQLSGIGGGRPTGFGLARVRSLPDGIAQMLQDYLDETEGDNADTRRAAQPAAVQSALPMDPPLEVKQQVGDLCPECGQASFINVEGCRKCVSCGYSEC